MKLIDADSLIEHAEVNCESVDFVEKLIDYVSEQEEISISQWHEDDLISRQEAIDALYEQDKVTPMTEGCLEMLLDRFEALPSAQPEIIRCKDCKYAEESDEREWLLCH